MQFGEGLARGTFHEVAEYGGTFGQIHNLMALANPQPPNPPTPQPQHPNPFPDHVKMGWISELGGGAIRVARLNRYWARAGPGDGTRHMRIDVENCIFIILISWNLMCDMCNTCE